MGIDIRIACRAKSGHMPPSPSYAIEGDMADGSCCVDGATHELNSMTRYYGPHYERGPWPHIAAYLMELMADPGIEAVWYGGDSSEHLEPVTLEWLTQMNLHYIDNGERPYRERVPVVKRTAHVSIEDHGTDT